MDSFAERVLRWGALEGRSDLPWQRDRDPYRIWLSEIMLQQTRVSTVIPYFERFIDHFPTVQRLAQAPLDEVLGLWSGLGYYARARNLHRAATEVCERFAGELPQQRHLLETLPGIGRTTAAAILSMAFEQPEAILDGNVKRVLCRHFAIEGWPGEAVVLRALWQQAEQLMPQQSCGAYTQAMMDLGATCCKRKRPDCLRCPLAASCIARGEGRAEELPHPRPGRRLPQRTTCMAILDDGADALWMVRRPEQGIWGGLWSFPEFSDQEQWPIQLGSPEVWEKIHHTFTHFKLEITPLYCRTGFTQAPCEEGEWVTLQQLEQRGVAAPVRRLIQQWREGQGV